MANQLPDQVLKSLALMGANLRQARLRRKETQEQFAQKIGISRQSYNEMEKGISTMSIGNYAMALWVIGMSDDLAEIAHPDRDTQGKVLEYENNPERIRPSRRDLDQYNF